MNISNDDIALEFVKATNASIFLTGRAGTGKSTLLKQIIADSTKNIVVLAPPGIAALNVGGVTIHSFFQLPHRTLLIRDKSIKPLWIKSEKRKLITSLDTVIIDEISMVRADVVDAIDFSLRLNSGNPHLPFGGKQMVFVGDLYQLEPIIKEKEVDEYLKETYQSPHFFRAKAFEELKVTTVELRDVHRQTDQKFIQLLDKIRTGNIHGEDLAYLNSRVKEDGSSSNHLLTLTTRVDAAELINDSKLQELPGECKTYDALILETSIKR